MLFTPDPSPVMSRCRRAFPKSARAAEAQTQVAPAKMNALERMRKHRELAKRPTIPGSTIDRNPDPGGTMRPSLVYEQAKRVRAQRLERIGKEADQ